MDGLIMPVPSGRCNTREARPEGPSVAYGNRFCEGPSLDVYVDKRHVAPNDPFAAIPCPDPSNMLVQNYLE